MDGKTRFNRSKSLVQLLTSTTAGISQKCTLSGDPGGKHLRRFWYMASVKKGVNGAMTLHTFSNTSNRLARAMVQSSGPLLPCRQYHHDNKVTVSTLTDYGYD